MEDEKGSFEVSIATVEGFPLLPKYREEVSTHISQTLH